PPTSCSPLTVVRPTSGMAGSTNACAAPRASSAASISAPSGPRSPVSIFLSNTPSKPRPIEASTSRTRRAAAGGRRVRLWVLRTASGWAAARRSGGTMPSEYTVIPVGHGSSAAATSHAPVRSSAMTCSGSTAIASGEEHRARGRAVQLRELERQTDQSVATRFDAPEIEALDDEHTGPQQQMVHRKLPAPELLDREVVDADGAPAALDQQPGGGQRHVGE